MKRIALILTLIGLVFAACSTAPVAEPDPVPGVIDLTIFPEEVVELYMSYLCYADNFGAEVHATIISPGDELDLDTYRPACDGPISLYEELEDFPQALLDAGFAAVTGAIVDYIDFITEDDAFGIYPEGLGDLDLWMMFYANDGGSINFEGRFPISVSILPEEYFVNVNMNVSYAAGWNLIYQVTEIGADHDTQTIDIIPLNTVEWGIHGLL